MEEGATYLGMDVHKRTIAVSVRFPGGGCEERTSLSSSGSYLAAAHSPSPTIDSPVLSTIR